MELEHARKQYDHFFPDRRPHRDFSPTWNGGAKMLEPSWQEQKPEMASLVAEANQLLSCLSETVIDPGGAEDETAARLFIHERQERQLTGEELQVVQAKVRLLRQRLTHT